METMGSVLDPSLEYLEDAVSDLRSAQYQNAPSVLKRLVALFEEEPLSGFLHAVLPVVDFQEWWEHTSKPRGSIRGSGELHWPIRLPERVAMQLALCRGLANEQIELLNFTIDYCDPGVNDLSEHIHEFVDSIVEPMVRDVGHLTRTRPLPPVLFEVMGRLPESGDQTLDTMLRDACQKVRDPAPAARRDAIERLWDSWERLKSLDHSANKRLSVSFLLDAAADDVAFRAILEAEATMLTRIGNDFQIRHFETNRSALTQPVHYDYLFHRLFALMYLLLFARSRGS